MTGIIKNFISANKFILGLLILAAAGLSAVGCATRAEVTRQPEPPIRKSEPPAAATEPSSIKINEDPYSEGRFDGDWENTKPASKKSSAKITRAVFEKIKVGMTLEEVERLLGDTGMLVSTMDVNGRKTRNYKWSSDNFSSYIDVTIENGKVVGKKDKGLK